MRSHEMSFPFHSFIICICTSDKCKKYLQRKIPVFSIVKVRPPEVPRPVPGYEARPPPRDLRSVLEIGDWRVIVMQGTPSLS